MSGTLRLMFVEARIYGLALVVGSLLLVQGYGAALTRLFWGVEWGPLAWAGEHVALPDGSSLMVGGLGLTFLLAVCFAVQHD